MPFISQKTLEELRQDARRGQDVKKLEKKFDKQLDKIRKDYFEREEDLTEECEAQVRQLERAARKVNEAVKEAVSVANEAHKAELAKLTGTQKTVLEAKNEEIISLNGKIKVLEGRVATAAALTTRELDLKDKEDEAVRAAELVSNREKALERKIKDFDARVKDENEAQYRAGFVDGTSIALIQGDERVATANGNMFKLAEKALDRDTTVITTTQTPAKQGK